MFLTVTINFDAGWSQRGIERRREQGRARNVGGGGSERLLEEGGGGLIRKTPGAGTTGTDAKQKT